MAGPEDDERPGGADARRARLAERLRANLRRRKAQRRARAAGPAETDEPPAHRPDGAASSPDESA